MTNFITGLFIGLIPFFIIFLKWLWEEHLSWRSFDKFLNGFKYSWTCFYCNKRTRIGRWESDDPWNWRHFVNYKCPKCKKWNSESELSNNQEIT